MGKRPYGYSTFTYDITDFVCFGEVENVISVSVNHEHIADSRWFTGSGIYRKVTLGIKDQISIDNNGLYIYTKSADEDSAVLAVECSVTNHTDTDAAIKLTGKISETEVINDFVIRAGSTEKKIYELEIRKPKLKLWSPDAPNLYTVHTTVEKGGQITDSEDTVAGIRTIEYDADRGFFLNGKNMKMKGVCIHHDAGCLGAAVLKKVWQRRLEKLKAMGCNAIRTSHNPHMPELYDLCDSMGFLVIDEAFDEWEGVKNKWTCGHNVYPPAHF